MRVPGFGPHTTRLAIVGEAPGAEEEIAGRPFVGSSGKLLDRSLATAGINRHECYVTNVLKIRPPGNDFGVMYCDKAHREPSPPLIDAWSLLRQELADHSPNLVLCLGAEALRAVTGKLSIDKWRGSVFLSGPQKVLSTYHPAFILRMWGKKPIFDADIRRAQEEMVFPGLKDLYLQFEINPSFTRVMEFLQSLLDHPRPISFDIETTENHVRCLGIADSATHAICIPFMSTHRPVVSHSTIQIGVSNAPEVNSHWTEEEEYTICQMLDAVFSSRAIGKIAQNFPFDSQVLGREFGFSVSGLLLDTMVAAHTMYAELPKGLDFLASLYTKIPYWSDYDPSSDEELWNYNCYDCVSTWDIGHTLIKDLKERCPVSGRPFTSLDFQLNHIQPAMQVMTRVGQRGVLIDLPLRDKLKVDYTAQQEHLAIHFKALSSVELNLGSTKQLQDFFYSKLKLPPQVNRKTGRPTFDEEAITYLAKKHPEYSALFDTLLSWREYDHLISTYLNAPLTRDNRLVSSFNVVGTVTGRCNSSRTIWGEGTNLQNIPVRTELGKPLRRMFIADPGRVLIKADLSQAEFRLVVWFANIRRLVDKYLHDPNYDCHRWVASLIYRCEEVAVTKSQRSIAKNGVYGGNYAMQPKTAAATYKIPLDQATFVLEEYRKAIPEIPAWWKSVEGVVNTTRTLTNPFGRVRVVMDRLDNSTFRDCYSHICQSTVADIIHRSVVVAELILDDCVPVLQIHDELVFSCATKKLESNCRKIKNIMEYPIQIDGVPEPLVIPAEISYGPNWLDQEKWRLI